MHSNRAAAIAAVLVGFLAGSAKGFPVRYLSWILPVVVGLLAVAPSAAEQQPSIKTLDWLIGSWTFEDAAKEGEYRETGTRVCEYDLRESYIVCRSDGTLHTGKERTYLFYFNYNHLDERFEISSVNSSYPRKLLYKAAIGDGGHRIELDSGSWEGDEIVFDSKAVVTYDGVDRIVWESANYRDIAVRND